MAKKVSTIVSEYIIKEIKIGHYPIGSKLPSERELMEILNVGRTSVREALNTLVDMDVLEKKMGIGVFVKKTNLTNLVDSYVISSLIDMDISKELLEFRLILEVEAAGIAALKATDKELMMMQESIEMYLVSIDRNKKTLEADELFHKSILLATQNSILINVYDSVSDLLHTFKQDLLQVENKMKSLQYHQDIFQAIKEKDEKEARRKMKEHLLEVTRRYQNLKELENETII